MLLIVLLAVLADATTDRAAIERVVVAVMGDSKQVSSLFTADADSELKRLKELDRGMLNVSTRPWSEVMPPRMVVQSIRFITPDVALVDAADTQYGSVMLWRVPVLFVMRREGTDWRIASLRVLTDRPPLR
jgi:hypothetical protein